MHNVVICVPVSPKPNHCVPTGRTDAGGRKFYFICSKSHNLLVHLDSEYILYDFFRKS